MEVIDDLGQVFLGLVLTGHIVKLDALSGLHIDLGVGFAHVEHHGVAAAHFFYQLPGHELAQRNENQNRCHPTENLHQQRGLLDLFAGGGNAGIQQALDQLTVCGNHGGFIDGFSVLAGEQNTVILLLNLHLVDLALFRHVNEGVVVYLLNLVLRQPRHGDEVEQHHQQHGDQIVEDQRLFRGFDLIHHRGLLLLHPRCGPHAQRGKFADFWKLLQA